MDGITAGSMLAHDNTYFGVKPDGYSLQLYGIIAGRRDFYGDANGSNPWDLNDGSGRLIAALDQPGRGAGDLISGDNPTPRWNNAVIEPCYSWNNVFVPTGEHINFVTPGNSGTYLHEGRDYFSDTPMPGYTPFTYPHPLTKGLPPEQMTRNATETSTHNLRNKRRPWGGKRPEGKQTKKAKEGPTNETPKGQENPGD
jgi:hypothetical protein